MTDGRKQEADSSPSMSKSHLDLFLIRFCREDNNVLSPFLLTNNSHNSQGHQKLLSSQHDFRHLNGQMLQFFWGGQSPFCFDSATRSLVRGQASSRTNRLRPNVWMGCPPTVGHRFKILYLGSTN